MQSKCIKSNTYHLILYLRLQLLPPSMPFLFLKFQDQLMYCINTQKEGAQILRYELLELRKSFYQSFRNNTLLVNVEQAFLLKFKQSK